jgi:methylglutaconyl-CoA hydratase
MSNADSTVHLRVDESVATITIDAPERRNALSAALLAQLRTQFDAAESDQAVRSVVLTHSGPVFCSGMDLTTVADVPAADQLIVTFPALLQRIWQFSKPVVARVDGKARAGGIGLVAVCDIAVASPSADFAFTEVRFGLVPAVVSVPVLPRVLLRPLLELSLTGETFDAGRAVQIGLLNSVVDDLDAEVARYTAMLRLGEPSALAATKRMLGRDRSGLTVADDFAAMAELSAGHFASPLAREGIAAFAERRQPSWT